MGQDHLFSGTSALGSPLSEVILLLCQLTWDELVSSSLPDSAGTFPHSRAYFSPVGVGIMIADNPLHGSGQATLFTSPRRFNRRTGATR
jgi:hypothetical protein